MVKAYQKIAEGQTKLPFDRSASYRTDIEGWICNVCRRYYGREDWSERAARSCCAESVPCDECGSHNPARSYCRACAAKRTAERYHAATRVEWDGTTPLALWDDDTYFFDTDDLVCWLEDDDERTLENTWLCVCKPVNGPRFDVSDWLCDYLNEDGDLPEGASEIERMVNDWVAKHAPLCWYSGDTVPTLESLRRHIKGTA